MSERKAYLEENVVFVCLLVHCPAQFLCLEVPLLVEHGILEPHGSQETDLFTEVLNGLEVGDIEEVEGLQLWRLNGVGLGFIDQINGNILAPVCH